MSEAKGGSHALIFTRAAPWMTWAVTLECHGFHANNYTTVFNRETLLKKNT